MDGWMDENWPMSLRDPIAEAALFDFLMEQNARLQKP